MKKVIRLTESDLTKIIKRVIMEDMMDVSSDSAWYQARKREQSIPGDDLSILIGYAKRYCETKGYNMDGRIDQISEDDCRKIADYNRKYSYL